jgi:hypothetical protein
MEPFLFNFMLKVEQTPERKDIRFVSDLGKNQTDIIVRVQRQARIQSEGVCSPETPPPPFSTLTPHPLGIFYSPKKKVHSDPDCDLKHTQIATGIASSLARAAVKRWHLLSGCLGREEQSS